LLPPSPLTVAFPLAIAVLIIDFASRGRSGQNRDQSQDRGSSLLVWVSIFATLVLVPSLSSAGPLRFEEYAIGWLGLAIMAVEIGIRAWTRVTLGRYFSVKLEVREKQPLVEEGPYARVRHPGYLGYLTMWTGLAVSAMSGLAIVVVVLLFSTVYSYRIKNEEAMLMTTFGPAYEQYRKRTNRLIPFIY
jgi:protein-S-isoprenylcysteine O-methyltransferase